MITSAVAPYLDCAYKLQEYDGQPRRKRSEGKATWPGRKQVFREYGANNALQHDVITLASQPTAGTPLLVPIVRDGRVVQSLPALESVRERVRAEIERLPAALRSLDSCTPAAVEIATPLRDLAARLDASSYVFD